MIEQRGKSTPEQKEILNITLEEAAEVIQSISKILRFGFDSTHPDKPDVNNREHFEEELGDFYCMMYILVEKGVINETNVHNFAMKKLDKLRKYSDIDLSGLGT